MCVCVCVCVCVLEQHCFLCPKHVCCEGWECVNRYLELIEVLDLFTVVDAVLFELFGVYANYTSSW